MERILESCREFVKYLKDEGKFNQRWKVKDLERCYLRFKGPRESSSDDLSFRTLLTKTIKSSPRLVYIIGEYDIFLCDQASWLSAKAMARLLKYERELGSEDLMKGNEMQTQIRRCVPTRYGVAITCVNQIKVEKESDVEYNHVASSPSPRSIELLIKNDNKFPVTLESTVLSTTSDNVQDYELKIDYDCEGAIQIESGRNRRVVVSYLLKIGEDETEIIFTFKIDGSVFHITRLLKFSHSSGRSTEPPSAFTIPRSLIRGIVDEPVRTIDGERPEAEKAELERLRDLPRGEVPQTVKRAAITFSSKSKDRETIRMLTLLESALCLENYSDKLDLCLHLETIQCRKDVARYNNVFTMTTRPRRKLLFLKVPGLAEKRPSVLRGDHIYARIFNSAENRCEGPRYKGYVHEVESKEVGIGFNRLLREQIQGRQLKFFIEFTMNTFPMQAMHRAIKLIKEHTRKNSLLFPRLPTATKESECSRSKLEFLTERVAENQEQKSAVENIVLGTDYTVYVIFGPPGTGKTVTLVEAIQQTILKNPNFHLIVSAPSNSACDLLTKRLLENKLLEQRGIRLLRLHAISRRQGLVDDDDVRRVSNFRSNGKAYFPPKRTLASYHIIVCTVITASRIASAKFPADHFNRVFIDEAGQATEPEVMTSIAGILADDGKLVIAGDPKQLGPVVRSSIANKFGFDVSYLERLMRDFPRYQPKEASAQRQIYDARYITKLLQNYRSHQSIINVSNDMFYNGELQAKAPAASADRFCRWRHLPRPNFPVIFAGVQGRDEQEANSPSFFNACEVEVVKEYLDLVLEEGVSQEHIGVITPYRKQVTKIRQLRSSDAKYKGIKVGSVEEFQGEERLVIIISTVRSHVGHYKHDHQFQLGFLRNPKRFNVAVTRAKSLLIVVGNPRVLRHDTHWKAFLKYCLDNDAYKNKGVNFLNEQLEGGSEDRLEAVLQESDDEN